MPIINGEQKVSFVLLRIRLDVRTFTKVITRGGTTCIDILSLLWIHICKLASLEHLSAARARPTSATCDATRIEGYLLLGAGSVC